uniref:Rab-GAP TBC domain-containing protein n=1 Tax=Arcella intermedia TaxID=1963864 RepID=A0A6B2L1V4_9EUKA
MKKQALSCDLGHGQLRIVSWKMFLGLLSTPPRAEEWIKEVNSQRKKYKELKSKYSQSSLDDEEDPNINNPLSLDTSSPWSKFFEDEQLRKTISQDVERTYPEYDYFQQNWVKEMMMGILFVYSKENSELSYKQGMHELLAPIIYMLDQEKMTRKEGNTLSLLYDENEVEGDAFTIFERIMKTTGCWFISRKPPPKGPGGKAPVGDSSDSPILVKCQHIYHNLLKAKDPGLYSYITSLKIEPQLFLLRWIRLLFGREFKLNETLLLWDAIFAFDKALTLTDHISVYMLMAIREQILNSDQNGVLQLLFKYPTLIPIAVESPGPLPPGQVAPPPTLTSGTALINIIVQSALDMAKHKKRPQAHQGAASPAPAPSVGNPLKGFARGWSGLTAGLGNIAASNIAANLSPRPGPPGQTSELDAELAQLKVLHSNIATRLENIVSILQTNLLPNDKATPDTVVLAVAELKQIKDVMMGHLPLQALPPIQPDPKLY